MILRKPYAFLIKKFKLIHIILTVMVTILLYRTNVILSFLNQYLSSNATVIGSELTDTLFSNLMYILPIFIIIISLIILSIMLLKHKPSFFYFINIIIAIGTIIIYRYTNDNVATMELKLLDARIIRASRDLLTLIMMIQCISAIICLVRATGFDIKKFNFVKDLQELDIVQEDNEEFELDVEVDTNQIRRNIRKRIRYMKYTYIEHRFWINIWSLLFIAITCFTIYISIGANGKTYSQGNVFRVNNFQIGVSESYITANDYQGKSLDPNTSAVIVKINVKSTSNPKKLNLATLVLKVGNHEIYPTSEYKKELSDIGTIYSSETISNEFIKYILIYKVPTNIINQKKTFIYTDPALTSIKETKKYKVALKTTNLDENIKSYDSSLGQKLVIDNPLLQASFKINSYQIFGKATLNYSFCYELECYSSVEYLYPSLSGNTDKTLMNITAYIDENNDIYSFLKKYGVLEYTIDETTKRQIVNGFAKANKANTEANYYLEFNKEIKDASTITLKVRVRNYIYNYVLKSNS